MDIAVERCLDPGDLRTSQLLGKLLLEERVQAIICPSIVGAGFNIVIFRALVTDQQVSLWMTKVLSAADGLAEPVLSQWGDFLASWAISAFLKPVTYRS